MKRARNAAFGLLVAAAVIAASRLKSWYEWRGPLDSAPGTVVSCSSRYDADSGMVYATLYAFADDKGSPWKNTTRSMRFCLPPGSPLKVEWPHGRPELARVEPAK